MNALMEKVTTSWENDCKVRLYNLIFHISNRNMQLSPRVFLKICDEFHKSKLKNYSQNLLQRIFLLEHLNNRY